MGQKRVVVSWLLNRWSAYAGIQRDDRMFVLLKVVLEMLCCSCRDMDNNWGRCRHLACGSRLIFLFVCAMGAGEATPSSRVSK
jgi:hypothetical protein